MQIKQVVLRGSLKGVEGAVVGAFQGDKKFASSASILDGSTRQFLKRTLTSKNFSGKKGEVLCLPLPSAKSSVLLVGLGKKEKHTLENVRRVFAKSLSFSKISQWEHLRVDLGTLRGHFSYQEVAQAGVEGVRLSDYSFKKYKTKAAVGHKVKAVELGVREAKQAKSIQKAIHEGEAISQAVLFTRDIANEPPNVMTPVRLAQAAKQMAAKNNLSCKVLNKSQIARLGMGGILGVSQGSSFPPQFVILQNRVKKAVNSKPIVLVGKGVTFDTGGISIKPSKAMDEMKFDMCGAAAVLGAMKAIANLKLPVRVVGLIAAVENMPGSKAQRPGDVIKMHNGKTVEVLNTDAEGRLILADTLSYANRYKPLAMVNIATLTGAALATFGSLVSAVMGTDEKFVQRVRDAGEKAGERCWELPLWDEYTNLIRGTYGDIQNISKGYAGTITAGMFLKEFAEHTRSWAHLDVAGTAWTTKPEPLTKVGGTGVGVRLFVELVKSYLKK